MCVPVQPVELHIVPSAGSKTTDDADWSPVECVCARVFDREASEPRVCVCVRVGCID